MYAIAEVEVVEDDGEVTLEWTCHYRHKKGKVWGPYTQMDDHRFPWACAFEALFKDHKALKQRVAELEKEKANADYQPDTQES